MARAAARRPPELVASLVALMAGLRRMQTPGQLRADADPARLATATMASLQGRLLLTQARGDPGQLRAVLDGAPLMLRAAA